MRVKGIFSHEGVDTIVLNYTAERMELKHEGDKYIKEFINQGHRDNCIKAMDKLDDAEFMSRFDDTMCAWEDILMYAVEEIV